MSTSTLSGDSRLEIRADRVLLGAVVVAGAAFVVEAGASIVADAHLAYHSLNTVLNLALLVASARFALAGRAAVGRVGVVGGWRQR